MNVWTKTDGTQVWAWQDARNYHYRAIWNPHKEEIDFIRSHNDLVGWPHVATVRNVEELPHALDIALSWYEITRG